MIAVAGATGALGSKICHALLARGATVRALVRDPAAGSARTLAGAGAELVRADITEPASLAAAVEGVACVVSTATCFPRDDSIEAVDRDGNLALVDAAEIAGASRFVFVSFKPVALDFPLQRAKRAVEERLAEARLDAVVLRPGKLMDVWFSSVCGFDASARRATLFGDGTAPVTWIAAADVAEIAARAAIGDRPHAGIVELGGPEPLSQREVVAIYEETSGAAWATETLPVAELERMHRHGETAVIRSLGALMLEAHLGATTDPASFHEAFPLRLTTVREFAGGGYSPSG
ncbi:MAG TPA: NmrA family NAD(P)-binding protein [Gaiellaceae bacterium]|nr:NmrA family NAD(P)-binding protein [Gaiellaceae bacterium]